MNLDSALDIYKDIAAGTAQINPLSDYFQESESDMKNKKPIFEEKGYSRPIHYQMPFSCEGKPSNVKDNGCDSILPKDQIDMFEYMEAENLPRLYGSWQENAQTQAQTQTQTQAPFTTENSTTREYLKPIVGTGAFFSSTAT